MSIDKLYEMLTLDMTPELSGAIDAAISQAYREGQERMREMCATVLEESGGEGWAEHQRASLATVWCEEIRQLEPEEKQ